MLYECRRWEGDLKKLELELELKTMEGQMVKPERVPISKQVVLQMLILMPEQKPMQKRGTT